MSGWKGKPKITIRPFKHSVQMDPEFANKTWSLLKTAIHEIHRQNASGLSFEELYRNAYNMVLHKYGKHLYDGLRQTVDEHLKEVAQGVASSIDDNFLPELNKAWNDHKVSTQMIRDILMYMDRVYVTNNNVPSVYDLGLLLFKENVTHHPQIKDRLLNKLLTLIYLERTGEVINRGDIKGISQMLVELGVNSRSVYEDDFEKPFLEKSAEFFRVEAQEFISSNSCSDYMIKAEQRIKEELERVNHYLDAGTESKIKEVVERELISVHMDTLARMEGSGEVFMLVENKIDDLKRMFTLFGRVSDGHKLMKGILSTHVKEEGKALIMDPERQKDHLALVQSLLEMKDKYDMLWEKAFFKDKSFSQTLNQAFENFINMNSRSPEYISLFIDEKLKKGLKGVTYDEVEQILDKVMMLFKFIQEKDVFEKYYKQHLAKRLLLGRSVSDDAEKSMLSKLKNECGYQFTSKLEGMFTDMKLSADTMSSFKEEIKKSGKDPLKGVDLNVYVLTTGFWPAQSLSSCILPPEINNCCEIFHKFYLNRHNGRKLSWQTNMGSAELKAVFGTTKRELNVTTYQMVILLLFNDKSNISFKEIQESTSIPLVDLKRNLLALSCGKYKVLLKDSEAKTITEKDVFTFNSKLKSKLFKIKILSVAQKETEPERKETRQKVDEDRKHQIEAALVRIMKARKQMEHSQLIAECTKELQSRFLPNPQIIKKRIESLIEREYLERSEKDRKVYNYLA